MMDVETRARRAGEAARTEAAARARHLALPTGAASSSRERRVAGRPLLAALGTACLVLVVVAVVGQLTRPATPTIEAAVPDLADVVAEPVAEDGILPVPPVGEAIPAYLADGTPVFVSHPEDGEVFVLEAFDGHGPGGIQEMVHWCPSSGWFEETRHSTRFNAYGDYTAGPAPGTLRDVPSELLGEGKVRVTGPPDPRRDRRDVRAEEPMRGPSCLQDDSTMTERAVAHEQPVDVQALDGSALPAGRWVWAQVRLGGPEGDPRVCELDGRCPADAPRFVDASHGGVPRFTSGELGTFLVRGEGSRAMLAVGPDPAWSPGPVTIESSGPRSLPVPDVGEAVLEQLDDGTPVVVTQGHDGQLHVLEAARADAPVLVASCPATGTLTDGSTASWALDGRAVPGSTVDDLRTYAFEVVEADAARAIRVTGAEPTTTARSGSVEVGVVGCPDELDTHQPTRRGDVAAQLSPMVEDDPAYRRWTWVDARLAEVDGELVLCVYLGPERCGEPVPTDDTTADCYGDLPTGGMCADRDPVVVTPGFSPTDGPVLVLARLAPDGRTVEVHVPPRP